jgi:spore coat polysaccharide biosynthesis protein SpsF
MNLGAIVQARMSSERLPGKVLHEIHGKPLLQYLMERLAHSTRIDTVVVATSVSATDDPIEEFCRLHQVSCVRGSLENVAGRFLGVLKKYPFDAFVRVNGDSPFLDQRLIDRGISVFLDNSCDLATNVFPRSFPSGQSVEVVDSVTYQQAFRQMRTQEELEHVTAFFYNYPDRFRICNFTSEIQYDNIHLSVDVKKDLLIIDQIIGQMKKPHWEYEFTDIIKIYQGLYRT